MIKHQLKLSNKLAQTYLKKLTDNIENEYNINTVFLNEPCGTGRLTINKDNIPSILIGTQISKSPISTYVSNTII